MQLNIIKIKFFDVEFTVLAFSLTKTPIFAVPDGKYLIISKAPSYEIYLSLFL